MGERRLLRPQPRLLAPAPPPRELCAARIGGARGWVGSGWMDVWVDVWDNGAGGGRGARYPPARKLPYSTRWMAESGVECHETTALLGKLYLTRCTASLVRRRMRVWSAPHSLTDDTMYPLISRSPPTCGARRTAHGGGWLARCAA